MLGLNYVSDLVLYYLDFNPIIIIEFTIITIV